VLACRARAGGVEEFWTVLTTAAPKVRMGNLSEAPSQAAVCAQRWTCGKYNATLELVCETRDSLPEMSDVIMTGIYRGGSEVCIPRMKDR